MLNKIKYMAICAIIFLAGCESTGPQKTLDELAKALESNNTSLFLSQFNMNDFAANYIKSFTRDYPALNSLNAFSNLLGIGNLDSLIGSVVDLKSTLTNEFERGVASGELMARCRTADTPDCPWAPQSLRDAHVVEVGRDAAIARITTPARLTSWLALRKFGENWLVIGHAVLEQDARNCALGAGNAAQPKAADTPKVEI